MSRIEMLNPQEHGRLRVRRNTEEVPHFVQIVISELPSAAAACPILLSKHAATGKFYVGALLGFKPGEPLLFDASDRGGFEPLALQRDGFFISGEHVTIDRDNARFSETEGDPLFDDAQQASVRLRQIQRVLEQLHAGMTRTDAFIEALLELSLIEQIDISLDFHNGEQLALHGLYTVSFDRLRQIDDTSALRLFRTDYLQLIYTMLASLKRIAILGELRNRLSRRAVA
jgi:hypothetical protein